MPDLCVNIDHVATVRQARRTWEPDPAAAALEAQSAGAAGITVHLREDRRHIQDEDLRRIRDAVRVTFNLEMAATPEMVAIAGKTRPQMAMLVPEGRQEITTEGGLDVASQQDHLRQVVHALREQEIPASAFIDADPPQIEAAAACGFSVCELHTGPWAEAMHAHGPGHDLAQVELERLRVNCNLVLEAGMLCNAGHALNYLNVAPVAALPGISELHIGHSIVSRSIFVGIQEAVREMLLAMMGTSGGTRSPEDA